MATTTHDEGFHEIQLNGKQLVFLFMAGTVVAVVIFLLGVFVGRGVRSVGTSDPLAIASATEQGAEPESPAIPSFAGSTGSGAPATAQEDLKYAEILVKDGKETLEKPKPESAAPSAAAPNAAASSAPAPSAPAPSAPAPSAPSAPAPSAPSASSAPSAPRASVPTEPAGDGFAIQLAALAKREEAEGIVRRLAGKGYAAYVMAPDAGRPQVYRVRVGKFKDRREAESVSSRLQKEEQFKPWIVR